jgi:hypothetical protein
MQRTVLYCYILFLIACDSRGAKLKAGSAEKPVMQQVANVSFTFPASGFAFENRDQLVKECLEAIKTNSALLELPTYNDSIKIQFLRSRQEMKFYTGMTPSGIALVPAKVLYVVANGDSNEVKPPIRHELMHMMAMTSWGDPAKDSNWMNEGLASYAENNCNGYNDEQIYRYLSVKAMLISMTDLTTSFYQQPEMIAYHQAAYIVQFLLTTYGVNKFKDLWIQGFNQFDQIYGIPFQQAKTQMDGIAERHYPVAPDIDWTNFEKGCLL